MDIAETLSRGHSQEKKVNGNMINDKFLGNTVLRWAGSFLRGHICEESNFIRLMRLRANNNPQINEWLS